MTFSYSCKLCAVLAAEPLAAPGIMLAIEPILLACLSVVAYSALRTEHCIMHWRTAPVW